MNCKINKPEVEDAKLFNASENDIKKEMALTKNGMGEWDQPRNLTRNLGSPLPFQSRMSEAITTCITQGPTSTGNVNKPEVEDSKSSNTYENGIKDEQDTNIYFASII